MNSTITILHTWPMLRDLPQNIIFSKFKSFILIPSWGVSPLIKNLKHSLMLISINLTGKSVLKHLNTKLLWLFLKSKTWRLISCFKMSTAKSVMFLEKCPSKTLREVINPRLLKNLSNSSNLPTDQPLLTSSRQSTRTKRSIPIPVTK